MRQYLVEGATGAFPFIVDRTKSPVVESRPGGGSLTKVPGRFSVCDCINGNNRRYSRRVWEKNLTSGSPLQESIKRNAAFGLLEHPKDGVVTLLSPISHHVTEAKMVESKDPVSGKPVCEVVGAITLFDTEEGTKLKALIDGGYNPFVSSRGYGSLQKAVDGVDDVQEDYVCESWDVVIKPSFDTAELTPERNAAASATNARLAAPVQPESKAAPAPETVLAEDKKNLKESTPSTGASQAAASVPPNKSYTMELNEIRGRITALEGLDPSKLTPQRFAESLTQIEELHQATAEYSADPKRSWDAQRIHKSLDALSTRFGEATQAPGRQAKKLQENNVKLMQVINAVAQTALTYKKKLGEALKAATEGGKLKEELIRRGQGWKKVAEERGEKLAVMEKDFSDSCEALDMISRHYHEDTTELARRLIILEFKEKAQTPEIQKQLKEATRLRHIAAIRETLEGKKSAGLSEKEDETNAGKKQAGVGKPGEGETATTVKKEGDKKGEKGELVADSPGKVTNESKGSDKASEAAAAPAVTESKDAKLVYSTRDPSSLSESVELTRRLSTATANK